ncbi:MAG: hypothetical protein C0412_12030 [Flavobacterium sp.]|nr:hypothetical protein [Flavobacterium sp.]
MNREKFYELSYMYLMNELEPGQRIELENLLMEDNSLKNEFDRIKETLLLVDANKPETVNEKILASARQSLMREIRKEIEKPTLVQSIIINFRHLLFNNYKLALGGAFTLILGICIGYYSFSPKNTSLGSDFSFEQVANRDLNISNISINTEGIGDGMVEVSYTEMRPHQYKVKATDPLVQKLLLASMLTDENPGFRLKSVNTIGKQIQENNIKDDPKVKIALITALKTDENAAVRKEALTLLINYKYDNDIRDSFLHVLSYDKNSGMRVAAINALANLKEKGQVLDNVVKEYLTKKAQNDEMNFVRTRAASLL